MKDSSQAGYVWAAPGPYEVQRGLRRRKRNGGIFVLVLFSFIGFMVFGMSYFASPYVSAAPQKGVGFATVAEKEIALVPYRRSGSRGLFQMITQDTFQVRLFAVELDTGRRLWDTQLSSMPSWQAKVITAGARNAYVATDGGLVILDLASGEILARDGDIQGLPNPVTSSAAYGYDAASTSIVTMSADGGLRTIPLDTVVAAPAPPELARAWRGKLSPQRPGSDSTGGASSSHGVLAGREKVELIPREDVPGLSLVRRTGNSGGTPIGETVFHKGSLPLTPPPGEIEGKGFPDNITSPAAGTPAGLVVVHHLRDLNSGNYAVSVVSVQTGQIVATHPIGPSSIRALTSPGKRTLLFADGADSVLGDGVATVGLDGHINWFYLGSIDFFGNPSL
ncbi:PA2928 family protein [Crossiella sp. CA198]|uniref:PA2928 family protein n=1 Tax=Crossiella sp. CA198 TaxID=3455607 RepID=UPI003F8D4FEA